MHSLDHAKKLARDLQRTVAIPGLRLATCQEASARILGYRDWHHLTSEPSHQPGDVDARRWRALREIAALGTNDDVVGIVNRLIPDPLIGRARTREEVISLTAVHPILKGYDELLGLLFDRHGPEFEVVADSRDLVHSGPLGRGVVHRDPARFLKTISHAYWSIFGWDPDMRDSYDVRESFLRVDRQGIAVRLIPVPKWLDVRPGVDISVGYDGAMRTRIFVSGAPDVADPARALNVWRNVHGHGGDVDFIDVTERSQEDGLDVFSVQSEDVERMLWTGRESCLDGRDKQNPVVIPRLEFESVIDWNDQAMDALEAIMIQDVYDGCVSRIDVERARRFMEAWGVGMPEGLRTQWLASPPSPRGLGSYKMLSVRDMGTERTEFEERATPDRLSIAEGASGEALWLGRDGHWHTRMEDHGSGDDAFLSASRRAWEDVNALSAVSPAQAAFRDWVPPPSVH